MEQRVETITGLTVAVPGEVWGPYFHFPSSLHVIQVEGDKYAANRAILPDGSGIDGLACFPETEDATKYMALPKPRGIVGEVIMKTFDEARQLAKARPKLNGLLLFVGGVIVDYHYVR
ncbi:MAG: hypothetical protein ACYC96_16725 [Fimbriimonadaceae bacterium]